MDEYVIIFKPHHIYAMRTIGDSLYWPMPRIVGRDSNKGCIWHRTLDRGFGGLIYQSWDGVYVLDRSLNVHCVSNNIEPTIQTLVQSISNPGGISGVVKIDTTKAHFEAGTATNIDTATVSGTFRVAKTAEAVDQSYTTGQDSGYSIRPGVGPLAQSFKPSINCICTKIELYLKTIGSPTDDITVCLKSDDNNSPGDTLASATISIGDIGSSYAYEIANITDTALTADTRYWIYVPAIGETNDYVMWGIDGSSPTYTDGNFWREYSGHLTALDALFKVYEQHYESSSNLISQIHDLGATPTAWKPFNATETLNGRSITWQVRSDDAADMSSPTAFTAVENGGIPSITLQRYVQWKSIPSPSNTATPVVDDVTIQAYLGTPTESPCAIIWDKGYLLCVKAAGSDVNNVAYRLDEDAWMRERRECWSPKLTGIYANKFLIYNDQIMSCSVGGTGLGGFLYYEDTGTKDLGSDFTATLITKRHDFSDLDLTYKDRKKIYRKVYSKYQSQRDASLYRKVDNESWASAITLSAQPNGGIEEDWFGTAPIGIYLTLKWEQTVADPDAEIHGFDVRASIKRLR